VREISVVGDWKDHRAQVIWHLAALGQFGAQRSAMSFARLPGTSPSQSPFQRLVSLVIYAGG
jgi:hypothetical protein